MTEGIYFLIGIILAAYFFLVALSPVVAYIAWSLFFPFIRDF